MSGLLIRTAGVLIDPASGLVETPGRVLVEGERIVAVGADAEASAESAQHLDLGDAILMPGLINAHQHGRGISQVLLGYPDDHLEPWIARRQGRGAPDPYALTRLAAANMLKNGVTATVHANYSYGSGDYAAEARASLRAYIDAGLRVTFCVGAMDRGMLVYPSQDETGLIQSLPEIARGRLAPPRRTPYAGGASETIALMRALQAEFGDHPLVTLAYGPAGPQWVSDELLAALAADARDHGLGIHLHLLESPVQASEGANLYPEGCLRRMQALGALGSHTALAHCVHVTENDMDQIAQSGAIVVHNPGSNMRLANGTAPVAAMLAAGIPVALGTDNCALTDDEDLLAELHLADGLSRASGMHVLGAVRARQLLAMVTTNGARARFARESSGRVEVGQVADLVAISTARVLAPWCDSDTSVLEAIAFRARGSDVVLTMVGGEIRQRGGMLEGNPLDELARAAANTARANRSASGLGGQETAEALSSALARLYGYR